MKPAQPKPEPATPDRIRKQVRRALEGILDEREIYSSVHRATSRIMETDGFYIARYDPATDVAKVVYWAERGEGREAAIEYPGSRSEVIRTGRGTLVEDQLESRSVMVLGEEGGAPTRSAVSVPLLAAGGVIGAISAQSRRPGAYSTDDVEVLQALADLAAAALVRTRQATLLQGTDGERDGLVEAILALVGAPRVDDVLDTAVDSAMDLLPGTGAVLWLLDGSTAWAAAVRGDCGPEPDFSVPLSGGGARTLVDGRESLLVENLQTSDLVPPRLRGQIEAIHAVAAPMVAQGRVSGILSVGTGADRPFTDEDARTLRRLADAVATALERARVLSQMESLSLTDSLTELPNRRQLQMHLAREFAAAQRGRGLSVILFDVDNFRQYNATLGRMAGDEVLRTLAGVLAGETRTMNLVGRYQGDEFVAILSDTPLEGARLHARRVEERIARHSGLGPHGITVSSGVAAFSDEMESPEDLLRAADHDLRRAGPAGSDG